MRNLKATFMQYVIRRSFETGLVSLLLWVGFGVGSALAQGSAGGSIGNDEKSLSGSRQTPRSVESEKPARKRKPEPAEPHHAARKSRGGENGRGGGNFDGAWVAVAVGTPCGTSTSRFVISGSSLSGELSSGQVSPNGATQTSGSVSGLSWNSTGRFSGRTGSGSFARSDGCTGRWTASKQ
jgi:hypothetical protein